MLRYIQSVSLFHAFINSKLFRKFEEVCISKIPTDEEWEREKNKTLQVFKMKYTME